MYQRKMSQLEVAAFNRHELHKDRKSSRPLSKDYELVGLAGEAALAKFAGSALDLSLRPGGDKGKDATITLMTDSGPRTFTVDVKTARKPANILVEVGKVRADIFIIAQYYEMTGTASLLAWQWGSVIKRIPPRDVGGFGVLSHAQRTRDARKMEELAERLVNDTSF